MDERDLKMQQLKATTENLRRKVLCLESQINGWVELTDRLIIEKADLASDLEAVKKSFADCRNELCERCGRYQYEYTGGCDGCKWKDKP